jgi:serine kinase of HPr protein (carbohydrate metabolism regulator)
MTSPSDHQETVHTSCVAVAGRAVLIGGESGRGKSDLALRLIDRGAQLVSDDYTIIRRTGGRLLASPPETIAGKMELRGVGIVEFPPARDVPVALFVDLDREADRLHEPGETCRVAGLEIPVIALGALEPSAPIKVEAALLLFGLPAEGPGP